ncbi:hypothetical protein PGB90_008562 [Kerria lacca]
MNKFQKIMCINIFLMLIFLIEIQAIISSAEIKKISEKCNANNEDLQVALKYEVPDTKSGKCLMLCMLKVLKTISADGIYNQTGTFEGFQIYWKELPEETLKNVSIHCKQTMSVHNSQFANTCEYGYLTIKCINEEFKQLKVFSN